MQGLQSSGPWRGILQDELLDLHASKIGDEGIVRPFEQDLLLLTPIASTHMQGQDRAVDAGDDTIDQLDGELQLSLRTCAGSQSGAHEGAGSGFTGEDQLREDGLIELDDIGAGRRQGLQLIPQNLHDVVGQGLTGRICRVERFFTQVERLRRYGPGSVTFTALRVCSRKNLKSSRTSGPFGASLPTTVGFLMAKAGTSNAFSSVSKCRFILDIFQESAMVIRTDTV